MVPTEPGYYKIKICYEFATVWEIAKVFKNYHDTLFFVLFGNNDFWEVHTKHLDSDVYISKTYVEEWGEKVL